MNAPVRARLSSPTPRFLFNQTPPSPQLTVCVVVPVRNEAQHIHHTLDALRLQRDAQGLPLPPTRYEVLVLANNCTDDSFERVQRYQQQFPQFALHVAQIRLPAKRANIGTVRRLLMDEAYRRLMSVGRPGGIIASTDGDTVVDPRWVDHTLREIANGNDAVGGRILTRADASPVRLNHLRDVTYRSLIARVEALLDPHAHDPWPRHFQHFGASLAVTCAMYQKAGRIPDVPYLEDEAFYRALLRTDAKVRKSPHVKVITSTRMQGRVAVGFSEQLRYWNQQNGLRRCQRAEPAEAVIRRVRNRHRLRACWQTRLDADHADALRTIAAELTVSYGWLRRDFAQSAYFGELWEKVERNMAAGRWPRLWQPVPITTAIDGLRAFLRTRA